MLFDHDKYGYNPAELLTSADEVWTRLNAILSDKVLRFNPYSVDDRVLLDCAERGRWMPFPALTQMVVFHFNDIHKEDRKYSYEAISLHIGNDTASTHLPVNALIGKYTYTATLTQRHTTIDGRPLTNYKMVEKIQRKDYFVSHTLPTRMINGRTFPAYRLFRLKGADNQKAETIRIAMTEAKLVMLNELLAYPYCPDYLRCSRHFIDYAAPIQAAIEAIRRFPTASLPHRGKKKQ